MARCHARWSRLAVCLALALLARSNRAEGADPIPPKAAEGLRVELVAHEPTRTGPVAMAFDARGQLWLATTGAHPTGTPERDPDGAILILEDTDGDGRADRTSLFADALFLVSGLTLGHGGVYVASGSEILHLSDTDGDGRADRRDVILSGFEATNPAHVPHGLGWTPEGSLSFATGSEAYARVETPFGIVRQDGCAEFAFQPRTRTLQSRQVGTAGNIGGIAFDRWGRGSRSPIEGGGCGVETLSGRRWPDELQGATVVADHRLGKVTVGETTLLEGQPGRFAPVDIKQGLDGALYVAEGLIPTLKGDSEADQTLAGIRVWRVSRTDRAPVPRPRIEDATIPELLELLKAPEQPTRQLARRALAERAPAAVVEPLASWTKALDANDPEVENHRVEALWLHEAIGSPNRELLTSRLRSPRPEAREAATHLLNDRLGEVPGALDLLAVQVVDESPRVRLEALQGLGRIPEKRAVEIALVALDRPVDAELDRAFRRLIDSNKPVWMPVMEAGTLDIHNDPRRLEALLRAMPTDDAVRVLSRVVRDFLNRPEETMRVEAFRLVGVWKLDAFRPESMSAAQELRGSDRVRAAAIGAIAELGSPADVAVIRALTGADRPAKTRASAIVALARFDPPTAAEAAVNLLCSSDARKIDPEGLYRTLIRRVGVSDVLAQTLAGRPLPADLARVGLLTLYTEGRDDPALESRLRLAAGLSSRPKARSSDDLRKLPVDARATGDPGRGELVFLRTGTGCIQCHSVGGVGGHLGPALDRLGNHGHLEDVLARLHGQAPQGDPVSVSLDDGTLLTGLKVRETSDTIILRDFDRAGVELPRSRIKTIKVRPTLMSPGLIELMTRSEELDLARFVCELGRPGPYQSGSERFLRRWRVLRPISTALATAPADQLGSLLGGPDLEWMPAYARFSGVLTDGAIASPSGETTAIARGEIDVTTAGSIPLVVNDPRGLTLLVDGKAAEVGGEIRLDLSTGVHVLTFRIRRGERDAEGLCVQMIDTPGSPARARFVTGR